MKKIIFSILLIVSFSCSKDDDESSSGETFLKKFDKVGFVEDDNQTPSYFYFYDSNVFIKIQFMMMNLENIYAKKLAREQPKLLWEMQL